MASTTTVPHPVNDFLTDDMVQFLKEMNSKTLKQIVTLFYGEGSNGKSCFVNILMKIKKCVPVHKNFFTDTFSIQMINCTRPELIIVNDPDNLEQYMMPQVLKKIKSFGIPVIILTNKVPDNLLDNELGSTVPEIKIVRFDTEYHHDDPLSPYAKIFPVQCKKALDQSRVDDDEAVKIVSKIMNGYE